MPQRTAKQVDKMSGGEKKKNPRDEHTYQSDSASGHLSSENERVIAVGGPIVEP